MTESVIKHTCDRCGNTLTKDNLVVDTLWYPNDWQHIQLGQTGAHLDICDVCNEELVMFLESKGASNMKEACINNREVL